LGFGALVSGTRKRGILISKNAIEVEHSPKEKLCTAGDGEHTGGASLRGRLKRVLIGKKHYVRVRSSSGDGTKEALQAKGQKRK